MNTNQTVTAVQLALEKLFREGFACCMYSGIRSDAAIAVGMPPNSKVFHAAWDGMTFSPADYGRDFMTAYAP